MYTLARRIRPWQTSRHVPRHAAPAHTSMVRPRPRSESPSPSPSPFPPTRPPRHAVPALRAAAPLASKSAPRLTALRITHACRRAIPSPTVVANRRRRRSTRLGSARSRSPPPLSRLTWRRPREARARRLLWGRARLAGRAGGGPVRPTTTSPLPFHHHHPPLLSPPPLPFHHTHCSHPSTVGVTSQAWQPRATALVVLHVGRTGLSPSPAAARRRILGEPPPPRAPHLPLLLPLWLPPARAAVHPRARTLVVPAAAGCCCCWRMPPAAVAAGACRCCACICCPDPGVPTIWRRRGVCFSEFA